jgi:hypothetical protein
MRMWRTKTSLLLEEIRFLRAANAQLQNYILMSGVASPLQMPRPTGNFSHTDEPWDGAPTKDIGEAAQRLYTTELEEDIEYNLQEGNIGEAEAKRMLREAAAIADDIELI